MKAGITIHVMKLELIGGQSDSVPRRLFTHDGVMVDVNKYYYAKTNEPVLYDQRGNQFTVTDGGWIAPAQTQVPADGDGQ